MKEFETSRLSLNAIELLTFRRKCRKGISSVASRGVGRMGWGSFAPFNHFGPIRGQPRCNDIETKNKYSRLGS